MTEAEAYAAFLKLRWPPDGEPRCLRCGSGVYYYTRRRLFVCKDCSLQFSPTTGTSLRCRKATFSTLIKCVEAVQADPQIGGLALSRVIGVNQKSAYAIGRAVREFLRGSDDRLAA